jgi:hypothetical protein
MVLIAPITVTAMHGFRLNGVFSAYVMVMMKCTWSYPGSQILLKKRPFNSSIYKFGRSNHNLQKRRTRALQWPLVLESRFLY